MKGGIMCHPRRRKSSTAERKQKDTNKHKTSKHPKRKFPLQDLTQKKLLGPYLIEFSYKRGTGKTHPYKKQQCISFGHEDICNNYFLKYFLFENILK